MKNYVILGILCALCIAGSVLCSEKQGKCGSGGTEAGGFYREAGGWHRNREELLKDVVAKDDRDGDVSDSVMISKIEKKQDGEENEFVIPDVGFDHSSNSGTLTNRPDLYRLPEASFCSV